MAHRLPRRFWTLLTGTFCLLALNFAAAASAQSLEDATGLAWMKYLAPLGVGGVLAAMIFFYYRQDFLTERRERQARGDLFIKVITDNTAAFTSMTLAVKEATRQQVETTEKIEHAVNNAVHNLLLRERLRDREQQT